MAADPDRVPRRRIFDAGAAADECLARPVRHLSDPGLAGRRRGGRPSRWSAGGRRRRLVVRLRLFARRPLLGRPRVSGRRQDLRLAAAIRGHCAAGRPGGVLRRWVSPWRARSGRAGQPACWRSRWRSRVAEWLRGHMFSGFPWNAYGYALVSPLWLAQGAALIGIWGLTFLAVAVYASPAVLADEPRRHQTALAGSGTEPRRHRRACGLWGGAARAGPPRATSRACTFASCSPICSRTTSSTIHASSR